MFASIDPATGAPLFFVSDLARAPNGVEVPVGKDIDWAMKRNYLAGAWVIKPKPPALTAEEKAALREAARIAEREAARDSNRLAKAQAIREEMPELIAAFLLDEITKDALKAARQAIRDRFQDPD